MPLFDFSCDRCSIIQEHLQSVKSPAPLCPQCFCEMRRKFGAFSIRGDFQAVKPHDWGWHDKTVFYQDGRSRVKTHNESYDDGLGI